jgi:hypothetical protein
MGKRFKIDTDVRSDDEILADLARSAKIALRFVREFPPQHPVTSLTFFGGHPVAPADFAWPRRKLNNWQAGAIVGEAVVPATFLAQIDCSELPAFDGRSLLPVDGVLHVFFITNNIDYDAGGDPLIVHSPGPTDGWHEIAPPADAPPCYGDEANYQYSWIAQTEGAEARYPRAFPKWPMRTVPVLSHVDEPPEGYGPGAYARFDELRQAAQAAVAATLATPERPATSPAVARGDNRLAAPFAGFPINWLAIEITAGQCLHVADQDRRYKAGVHQEAVPDAATWVARARAAGEMSAVDAADAAAFWDWIDAMSAAASADLYDCRNGRHLNEALKLAARLSVEVALAQGGDAAAGVPASTIDALRGRHSPVIIAYPNAVQGRLNHELLGHPRQAYNAIRTYGDSHVHLLHLESDEALGWMFGDVHTLQFWVPREDLAALRFDQTVITMSEA